MSEFRGTPGPWQVLGKQGTAIWAGDVMVAQMSNPRENHSEARANAVLMAASHDMLEALQAIVISLVEADEEGLIEHAEQIQAARAAIAKATKD